METPKVWCVRAHGGRGTEEFVRGEFVGLEGRSDLTTATSHEDIEAILRSDFPDANPYRLGQIVGIVERFRLRIRKGDIVVTPDAEGRLRWGTVRDGKYRFVANGRYPHRFAALWTKDAISRAELSVPLQATLRSAQTVFEIDPSDEVLRRIGKAVAPRQSESADWREAVLGKVLELQPSEFEILTAHLLSALGFEETEVTGRSGDGGVDVVGQLDISGLARIKLFVQAKRYKLGSRITASTVRALRAAIARDGQGAFITTADFDRRAYQDATDPGFPRIGLVNGQRLVDLLGEHWAELPEELRRKLGLRPGLVPLAG